MKPKPNAKRSISVLGQLCKEIAPHLVAKVVRQVEARLGERDTARKLDVWSHTVSLIYCHSTNCLSLNDVCDGLSFHAYELNAIRNAVPPTRSTLSRANRERSSEYIKAIYEAVAEDLKARHPKFFGRGERCFFRLPKRFKRAVRAIDSTTIELIANCMDWAQHRRRKAAAKIHLSLDPGSFLPVRIIVEPAKGHDANSHVSQRNFSVGRSADDGWICANGHLRKPPLSGFVTTNRGRQTAFNALL